MTGQNEIRLNHQAMRDVVQHYLEDKLLGVFAPEVEVTKIVPNYPYGTGGDVQFVIHVKSLDKVAK